MHYGIFTHKLHGKLLHSPFHVLQPSQKLCYTTYPYFGLENYA
jgi:hypothetical protein